MTTAAPYAVAYDVTPSTGDLRYTDGQRVRATSPMLPVVLRILLTDRGSYLPDPSLGLDYALAQKLLPNSAATWRAAILEALRPLSEPGLITDVAVSVSQVASGLHSEVVFHDPAASTNPQRVTVP